jgi:peptide deformylase
MIKPIIRNLALLRHPCDLVLENEDISQIVTDLRDTFQTVRAHGLAANQIGYNKKVAYIVINGKETILVNPKILEKDEKILHRGEGCLSIPGVLFDTDRWNQISVKMDRLPYEQGIYTGLEAIIIQHEVDHLEGRTVLERKHKAR